MTPAELDDAVAGRNLLQVCTERPDVTIALLDHAVDILVETDLLDTVRQICAAQQVVLATGGGTITVDTVDDTGVAVYEATL